MSNAAILAAANFLSKEAKRVTGTVPVGTHSLKGYKVVVDLDGIAKKGADEDYVPTIKTPLKAVLALVFQRMGIQQPLMREMFIDAMTEALRDGEKAEGYVAAFTKNYETWEEEVTSTLAALPKAMREGKFTVNGADATITVQEPTPARTPAAITAGK